jgi:hypothetical protein
MSADMLSVAIDYVLAGLPVFPIKPCTKEPATRHGLKDASLLITDMERWWTDNPIYNIGIAIPDGMVVVDVDTKHDGLTKFAELVDSRGSLPVTWEADTGGGGKHYWLSTAVTEFKGRIDDGIDLRVGGKHYVVAPPSVHPNGSVYRWVTPMMPMAGTPAAAPQWLEQLIAKPQHAAQRPTVSATGRREPSVADQFCAGTTWATVLEPHGWVCLDADGDADGARWRHPDATAAHSATIKHGCLFVYSTNTPFETTGATDPHGYTKFRAYAMLNHGGDMSGAARALLGVNGREYANTDIGTLGIDNSCGTDGPAYTDFGTLLANGLPDPPEPDVLPRTDGVRIFYDRKRNDLFGDPEDGKTMVLLAAAADKLNSGGNVLLLDLDNNGAAETAQRMIMLGADSVVLADRNRFRHIEPEDADDVLRVVTDCAGWATLAGIDCVGELLPLFRANSDSADDYTRVMHLVSAPLERGGAAVILLDHQAKGQDSRAFGAGGTMAKRRAISGVSINLVRKRTFTPGKGGVAELWINKDRPGGLRRHCTGGEGRRQFAGTFMLDAPDPDTGVAAWRVTTERTTAPATTIDPVVERHYQAAVAIGGTFNTTQLAARANGLPEGTPHTEAQKKAAQRAAGKLVEQGRFELVAEKPQLRWAVSE